MSQPVCWTTTQPYDSIEYRAGIQYQTYRGQAVRGSIARLRAKHHVSENSSATACESRIPISKHRAGGIASNLRGIVLVSARESAPACPKRSRIYSSSV